MNKLYSVTFPTKNKFQGLNSFIYSSNQKLDLGDLVLCSFGKKELPGIITKLNPEKPKFKFKEITKLLLKNFIPASSVKLNSWISDYYLAGHGQTLELFCTQNLIKRILEDKDSKWLQKELSDLSLTDIKEFGKVKLNRLNSQQSQIFSSLQKTKKEIVLLHGATGSGKTEIYLHATLENIKLKRSTLILVPEIGLTTQNINRFKVLGVPLITLHSNQTPVQKARNWQLIKKLTQSSQPIVVLGPRSAMFSPIFNLGLIIIDEFHDASYKQDSTPKYNSILTGAMLTKLNPNSKLILGSATPNVADYHNLTTKQALLLEMGTRHNQTKQVSIIDSRQADNFSKSKIISEELYQSIKLKLSNLEQSLIFHNRRGSSRLQVCSTCDWVNNCPNCHIPLVFHADEYSLRCHTCGFKTKPELICPVCSSATLSLRGYGTKQIVSELEKLFPEARIIRFDADNTKKESTLAYNFEELQQGKFDIIVGTQILAKGLDLPKLSLVGILQAESGLTMPDFRSSERTFQLITQVIGRVGRGHLPGQVIIQTLAPNHPAITLAAKEDYTEFYNSEITERKSSLNPPFRYQAKLYAKYNSESSARRAANLVIGDLKKDLSLAGLQIIGPSPAFKERVAGKYQYQIIIKSPKRELLQQAILNHLPTTWNHDLDPLSLL